MRLRIESTDKLVNLNGVPCRVWEGLTESGVPCKVFVHRLAVDRAEDTEQFDRELAEQLPPGVKIDLRHVL